MIGILNGNDPSEIAFRFTMHWLAAPLQQVGRNLQTNLWHIGEKNGTGKGTLSHIMSMIYGFNNAKLLNEDELAKGGWTDTIEGALFVAWNEIRQNGQFDANSFIKQNSTEAIIQIRKRNHHSHPAINHGNWYITGNRESAPWGALDFNDRRNAIFATTDDNNKLWLAKEVREWMEHQPGQTEQVLAGFVYLLQNIVIDQDLIARAPDSELKAEMQSAASPETDGLYWLENDIAYARDQWLSAKDYLTPYRNFTGAEKLNPRRFSASVLSKLARKGFIEKQQKHQTSVMLFRISSAKFPVWTDQPDESRPENAVIRLLDRTKRQ